MLLALKPYAIGISMLLILGWCWLGQRSDARR